jgi:putative hemolysin
LDEPPSQPLLQLLAGNNPMVMISLAVIFLLLTISGLVSASEVAFFSLKSDDLDRCRERNSKPDQAIIDLLNNPRQLLATILVMNNTVNVGIVTLSTFLMWELAGTRRPEELMVLSVTLAVTVAITFFGEIIPKVYATKHNMSMARLMSGLWKILIVLCRPVTVPLMKMSHFVEKRFEKRGYHATVEELHQALEIATSTDETTQEEREILKGIVNFGTISVKQIMQSRVDIAAVDIEKNFHELVAYIKNSGFSRMPVYRETLDKVEGVLHIKDLLPFIDREAGFNWQTLVRPGFFVPETKKIDSLLKDFQEKHVHMAIVVDEYGGTSGLVTLEDVIEEIIGEINDEFDEAGQNFQRIDEHTYIFEGRITLHDFCKVLNLPADTFDEVRGESESLGGLILELNEGFPSVGDRIRFRQFTFTIESLDKKRIKRVRVTVS